jgi:hypothetical protein
MKENGTVAKVFAGFLVAGVIAVGGMGQTTAQAKDTGWNGTVAPSDRVTASNMQFRDTGWNGT